jgi:hypothetical protein
MRVIGLVPHPDNKVSIKALEQFLSNIRSQQQTGDSCIEKNWSALHQGYK